MTVIETTDASFNVDVSREGLNRTVGSRNPVT
ncbi:riboflavin synthase subunit alpha [Burkholderia lata]|uniref:Riboflavin synthase subunit alpha n=1 Tax=Burkholderia lata (strain ATCC 17760 / DSM 23089 / LMG 22485 / NCIMB 9086 / R18194 / 383) TaxID=482957 RepID=A0A6P2YZT1_BURL3|nr:riboflavin synthase subunit alpha [Burkholderia lata]